MISCKYLVIGAGQTGLKLCEELLKLNESVILVEQGAFGGSYLNSYDYPKNLLSKESENFAVSLKLFKDYPETFSVIRKYRQKISAKISQEINKTRNKQISTLEKNRKFKFLEGKAEFFSKSLIEVNSTEEKHLISFNQCILAVGKTVVKTPEIKGIDKVKLLHQHNAYLFEEIPSKLAILRCTKETLELASIYSGLGIKITIFEPENSKKALANLDRSAFNYLITVLDSRQVEFKFKTSIKEIKKAAKIHLAAFYFY
jgi:dihydrolipoamide dehydrogenase